MQLPHDDKESNPIATIATAVLIGWLAIAGIGAIQVIVSPVPETVRTK